MLKITGIILICSASAMWGNLLSQKYKRRIALRNELLQFLEHLISGVKYGTATLNELYLTFKAHLLKPNMIKSNIFSFLDVLDSKEQKEIICAFNSLGMSKSKDKELMLIERYYTEFENTFKAANQSDKNKSTLYRKLSVITSLILAVILL